MWRYRTNKLTLKEVKVLLKIIPVYAHAHSDGATLPELPRNMSRQFRIMWIWSAYRVSIEQPTHFALGVLLSIPAIGFLLYQLVMNIVQLIEPMLSKFISN